MPTGPEGQKCSGDGISITNRPPASHSPSRQVPLGAYLGVMRFAFAAPALIWLAVGCAPLCAQSAPDVFPMEELERLKACFDKNLADLVPSGEPIATISKAIEVICEEDIETVARKVLRDAIVERGKRVSTREAEDGERFLKDKVRSLLLAYGLRFKAKGGPTTLAD